MATEKREGDRDGRGGEKQLLVFPRTKKETRSRDNALFSPKKKISINSQEHPVFSSFRAGCFRAPLIAE